ncbi:MAG: 50S ribosomal protein L9 [Myxococcales bacterium]|nr:50S ribosomal protein L9 [Myxococcales bacterium]
MQVILQKDVPKLGTVGEVVNVKPGYARNYLIPRGMALMADAGSVRSIEHAKRLTEHAKRKARAEAEALAERMKDVNVTLPVRVGENDRLYGSVTARDIAKDLALQGWPVEAKRIVLESPIKTLGVFQVPVALSVGVVAEIKVWVVQDRSAPEPSEDEGSDEEGSESGGADATVAASAEADSESGDAGAIAEASGDEAADSENASDVSETVVE